MKEAKGIYNKLCSTYEGDSKTQQARLLNLKNKFKGFGMVNDESVESYIHNVNDTTKAIQVVGGVLEEIHIIRKILFIFTRPYKLKKCVIKEYLDPNNQSIDQLIRTLSTYEIGEIEDIKSY